MAYLRDVDCHCHEHGCYAMAKVELVNDADEVLGRYCASHGKKRLLLQDQAEATAEEKDRLAEYATFGWPSDHYDAAGRLVEEP